MLIREINAKILKNELINADFYKMTINAPSIASNASPGQFLMIKVSSSYDPFLRRPISINFIDEVKGTITILYQVVGKGTSLMSQKKVGEKINVLGPLGNGFGIYKNDREVILIGGGCGIAPLVPLAKELINNKKKVHIFLGAQTRQKIICEDDFYKIKGELNVSVATDDGSYGHKGFVTKLLDDWLKQYDVSRIYCCGPLAMTQKTIELAQENNLPCEVSLEERMGCGIGACIGCAVKIKRKDGTITYAKVCKDGPVFQGNEVILDG